MCLQKHWKTQHGADKPHLLPWKQHIYQSTEHKSRHPAETHSPIIENDPHWLHNTGDPHTMLNSPSEHPMHQRYTTTGHPSLHQRTTKDTPDHHKNTTPGRGATLGWAHHQQKPASHPPMHPQLITHWSQHHSHTPGATLRPWKDQQIHWRWARSDSCWTTSVPSWQHEGPHSIQTSAKQREKKKERKKKPTTTLFLNILDYIRKGLPLFLKTRTLYIELLKWLFRYQCGTFKAWIHQHLGWRI